MSAFSRLSLGVSIFASAKQRVRRGEAPASGAFFVFGTGRPPPRDERMLDMPNTLRGFSLTIGAPAAHSEVASREAAVRSPYYTFENGLSKRRPVRVIWSKRVGM